MVIDKEKIIAIILCIMIVISIFSMSTIQANATPIAIPIAAAVLVGSLLVASGLYFSNQESLNSAINDVWEHLSTGVKREIEKVSLLYGTAVMLGDYALNQLSEAVYNLIDTDTLSTALTTGTQQSFVINTGSKTISQWLPTRGTCYYLQELGFLGTNIWTSYYDLKPATFLQMKRYISGGTEYIDIQTASGGVSSGTWTSYNDSAFLSVTYSHTDGDNKYYQITVKNDDGNSISGGMIRSTTAIPLAHPQNNYSVDPNALLDGVVNKAISDGIVDETDVSSNVGTNSITAKTPFVVPPLDWGLADLVNQQQQYILELQQKIAVLTDLSTGEMTSEGELVGDGTGTGIFSGVGKWIMNIPLLGSILQALLNIIEAILDMGSTIIDGIVAGIRSIFIPPDFNPTVFLQDTFDDLQYKFGGVGVDITNYESVEIPDLKAYIQGKEVIVVNNQFIRDNIQYFRYIIQGLFAILLVVFNYTMVSRLINSNGATAGMISKLDDPKGGNK